MFLSMSSSECSSSENSSSESSNEESQASYHEEVEEKDNNVDVGAFDNGDHEAALDSLQTAGPYSDEPLASELWMQEYNAYKQEVEEEEKKLLERKNKTVPVSSWCKCGYCQVDQLKNIGEYFCCTEIEDCMEALKEDDVLQDSADSSPPSCVTSHPGFRPVCLEKWSLRYAAGKFKTRQKKRYRQTGSEERYLRRVSYRQFMRMVYGPMGKKRVPLPACAYHAIRTTFQSTNDSDEELTGYVGNDD